MKKDLIKPFYSSFLSCEKDTETILRKLFVEDTRRAEELKRLLVINTRDCLDNRDSQVYKRVLEEMTLPKMVKEGYIRLKPKVVMPEHEEVKSYMIISYDHFTPNARNPKFRDCNINFDIICNDDAWELGDYRIRPLKIVGYIDGLLNESKLSGIGTLNFLACKELLLDNELNGYTLIYRAIHGSDDIIPSGEL